LRYRRGSGTYPCPPLLTVDVPRGKVFPIVEEREGIGTGGGGRCGRIAVVDVNHVVRPIIRLVPFHPDCHRGRGVVLHPVGEEPRGLVLEEADGIVEEGQGDFELVVLRVGACDGDGPPILPARVPPARARLGGLGELEHEDLCQHQGGEEEKD